MYPLSAYFDRHFIYPEQRRRLNEAIAKRYRDQGIRVGWLIHSHWYGFSREQILQKDIKIIPEDHVLKSGQSLEDVVLHARYPDPRVIVDQLPKETSKIILAGFHVSDCIDRLARVAVRMGYVVTVDEDLTDNGFETYSYSGGLVPLDFDPNEFARLRRELLLERGPIAGRCSLALEKFWRYRRPWVIRI